jgi:hypothetical protein
MTTHLRIVFVAALVGGACGGLPEGPTAPPPAPESAVAPPPRDSVAGTPVLGSPAASPTPTPDPSPEGGDGGGSDPTPPPADPAGAASFGCGAPIPPEISRLNVKVHVKGDDFWTLDSTPLVGPNAGYCTQIGYTDGREYCPVRPEGHPEREGCEAWAVGTASDTGRVGPTWTRNGSACSGRASGCENAPDNQYLVRAWAGGTFRACARNGACGEVGVDK